jgi:glycosyltransferase involved in cell wall biosynthesis
MKGVRGLYAYEDAACHGFQAAERLGIKRFYDLPIAYWKVARRLLEEEAARLPAWAATLAGKNDSEQKLAQKDDELRRAEVVFCASRFVADSLPDWARTTKEIVVAPFGSPAAEENGERDHQKQNRKLRVLFAGSMSQRKGLGDLFAAMRLLRKAEIELVVMGSPLAPMEFYRRAYPDFVHEPTRPHFEVLRLMRSCDVLVLPSIVEGRALVVQEAMSQGLPILITANTGGEDLVESGRTGFLVPIRAPEAIAERLAWFAGHREETRAMGGAARAKAATYTWPDYSARIVAAIERRLAQPHKSHHGCQIS